jgi:hypothetical protein
MNALLIRAAAFTAHFRDPRINSAKVARTGTGLPARTLRCPPPCTIHGLVCAARGGWVEPATLRVGWRLDYAGVSTELQTNQLPQRTPGANRQPLKASPIEREFLAFPVLTIVALAGVERYWFNAPANPLSLGRSEDMIVEKSFGEASYSRQTEGLIERQCLPLGLGSGTVYAAPLYFEEARRPVAMAPRVDAVARQLVRSPEIICLDKSGETFYVWSFESPAR